MKDWDLENLEEDLVQEKPSVDGPIDRVGIEDLEMPIQILSGSQTLSLPAVITAMVSLDQKNMRGIHISRIYLKLHDFLGSHHLSLSAVKKILHLLVETQKGISQKAYLKVQWKWPVKRKALKSQLLEGWRCYPVFYEGCLSAKDKITTTMGMQITYSSTCPCSAHLARTLIQQKFNQDFSDSQINKQKIFKWLGKESSISATPHAQKSQAFITVQVKEESQSLLELISEIEKVLGTPVQTAVKREDEQEFAKLNSENLMFSEDAVRRIAHLLKRKSWISHYNIHVKHFESLHPFEVASLITK